MPEHKKLPLGVGFRQGAHPLSARPFLSGNGSTLQRTAADAHEPHTQSLQRTSPRLAPELPQAESTVQATYMTALAALNPLLPAPPTSSTYQCEPGATRTQQQSHHLPCLPSSPHVSIPEGSVIDTFLACHPAPAPAHKTPLSTTTIVSCTSRLSLLVLSAARSACLRPR